MQVSTKLDKGGSGLESNFQLFTAHSTSVRLSIRLSFRLHSGFTMSRPMTPAISMEKKEAHTDLLNALSAYVYTHISFVTLSSTTKMGGILMTSNSNRLRFTGRYSDLTITCNYRQWAVHRAIVCSRSGFFDAACSNPCLESNSGIIDLSEDDEEAVEQMVHCEHCPSSSKEAQS